jgi:hypothetical protein
MHPWGPVFENKIILFYSILFYSKVKQINYASNVSHVDKLLLSVDERRNCDHDLRNLSRCYTSLSLGVK